MAKTVPDAEVRIYIYIGTYLSIHHVYRDVYIDIATEIDVYIGLTRACARDRKDIIGRAGTYIYIYKGIYLSIQHVAYTHIWVNPKL